MKLIHCNNVKIICLLSRKYILNHSHLYLSILLCISYSIQKNVYGQKQSIMDLSTERSRWVYSPIEVHTDRVIVLNLLIEKNFHETVRPKRFLYFALNISINTLSPILLRTSIGRKYLTSWGLKNMKRTVERRLFILNGYPVRIILSRITCIGSHLISYPRSIGAPSSCSGQRGLTLKIKNGLGGKWLCPQNEQQQQFSLSSPILRANLVFSVPLMQREQIGLTSNLLNPTDIITNQLEFAETPSHSQQGFLFTFPWSTVIFLSCFSRKDKTRGILRRYFSSFQIQNPLRVTRIQNPGQAKPLERLSLRAA